MTESKRRVFNRRWSVAAILFGLYAFLAAAHTSLAATNIAPYSILRSSPYVGAAISYLVDGKLADPEDKTLMMSAPLPIRIGRVMPLQYEFTFPQQMPVIQVRLFQHRTEDRRPASGYIIEVDTNGDRIYEKQIVTESQGQGGRWFSYSVSPAVLAYGLRFRSTAFPSYSGPNYGGPAIGEVEIYTDAEVQPISGVSAPTGQLLKESAADAKLVALQVSNSAAPWRAQFHRGLFGTMWLFWPAGTNYSEQDNAPKIDLLKKLKVNRYWLFPNVYVPNRPDLAYLTMPKNPDYLHFINRQIEHRNQAKIKDMGILPFPSAIFPSYKENILRVFVAQMHENNIGVIVVNPSLLPYGLKSWDFPKVVNTRIYPDVLSSSFVRDASTQLYTEFMEAGVDGLAVGGDEFFLHGHNGRGEDNPPICKDANGVTRAICRPTCESLFKQKFGIDIPPPEAVSFPLVGKWKIFEYEQVAELFSRLALTMKSTNSAAVVTTVLRAGEENRPAYGVAYDILGSLGGISEMSSNPYWSDSYLGHYYFANETKKLLGASRDRKAAVTLQTTPNFDRNGYRDPVMVYGPAFSSLMHGASGINFYKQDYLFSGGSNDAGPWVEKFFSLTALLEQKGLLNYRVPKAVALLYSRASEDWWQLAHPDHAATAAEGILYQNAVMEVLFRNGIPFDLYYLDQPSTLNEIGKYSLAIMPYPYSIGRQAVAKIQQAVSRGTRIIALKRKGETDDVGVRYQTPVLESLAEVEHLSLSLGETNYSNFSKQLMPVLVKHLGNRLPLLLNADGKDIECSVLVDDSAHLVFCLNWEKHDTEVSLGLNLPDGNYKISVITMEYEKSASINAQSAIPAAALKDFRLALQAGEAKVLTIDSLPRAASIGGSAQSPL